MTYQPQEGDEGLVLIFAALRDYLATDTKLLSMLPEGADSILPEGFLEQDTPTPVVMFTTIGDGDTDAGVDSHLLRLVVYALDRGRGYMNIERINWRLRELFNDTIAIMRFLSFPAGVKPMVTHVMDSGGTASASYPRWNVEGRGRYLFVHTTGDPYSA